MEESVFPSELYNGLSEREYIIKMFNEGRYEVLVAMKCLDEGVDIPSARNAILMANDGNPRQYVQRLGRILRRMKGKTYAIIIDIIVVPRFDKIIRECREFEYKIFDKEIKRYWEIAKLSLNNAESEILISNIINKYKG
jgi:superfamily II DNA or RNA helicase